MSTAYSHSELADLEVALAELTVPAGSDLTSAVMEMSRVLERQRIPLPDQPDTVRQLATEWRSNLACPEPLREAITSALSHSRDPFVQSIASHYFELHGKLQTDLAMTFEAASIVTGYTSVIGSLAQSHSMSSAQIATLLRARGVAADTATWAAIQRVLSALSLSPNVGIDQVTAQLASDLRKEETLFADADWADSIASVTQLGSGLGMRVSMAEALASIVPRSGEAHWPYVFMLHYSCVPLDWHDHAPVFLYEFSPRGQSASLLLGQYEGFDTGADPFLNNAKSVDRLDQNWADSKTKQGLRKPASALVAMLEAVGALPYQAKRAFGAALRQWCLRQLRLHRTPARLLEAALIEPADLRRLLAVVAQSESNTRGILEQRMVDAVTFAQYRDQRWKPRGLGDSVNAANTPRRKLGDCEYQDSAGRSVQAFEAHAGHLSQTYLMNHQSSLRSILRARLDDEWLAYSEPTDWDVNVTFVSHSSDQSEPIEEELEGVRVRFSFLAFSELLSSVDVANALVGASFELWLLDLLNHPRTPQSVRDQVTRLAN